MNLAPADQTRAARAVPIWASGGLIRAFAMVDAEDYARVAQFRWHAGSGGYVQRKIPLGPYRQGSVVLHRELLGLTSEDARQGDHRNGDVLDNRRSNLRIVSHAENAQNVHGGRGTSKYRGVSWDKQKERWHAYARVNGHLKHLGFYEDERLAADAAARFREIHMPFSEEGSL